MRNSNKPKQFRKGRCSTVMRRRTHEKTISQHEKTAVTVYRARGHSLPVRRNHRLLRPDSQRCPRIIGFEIIRFGNSSFNGISIRNRVWRNIGVRNSGLENDSYGNDSYGSITRANNTTKHLSPG